MRRWKRFLSRSSGPLLWRDQLRSVYLWRNLTPLWSPLCDKRPFPKTTKVDQPIKLLLTLFLSAPQLSLSIVSLCQELTETLSYFITHYVFFLTFFPVWHFFLYSPSQTLFFLCSRPLRRPFPQTFTNEMKEKHSYVTILRGDAPLYLGLLKHKPPCDWLWDARVWRVTPDSGERMQVE